MDVGSLIAVIVGAIFAGYGAWRGFGIGWKKAQKKEGGKDGHSQKAEKVE
jgi:hypothetical protein